MPYVIEPAAGLSRSLMTFLVDAYPRTRRPTPRAASTSAPCCGSTRASRRSRSRCCRCRRNADLSPKAKALAAELRRNWNVDFDDSGAIGRRYRRQDEIGTPYCVTVDFDTLEDDAVTVRERDTMEQERIGLDGITSYFAERFVGCLRTRLVHTDPMRHGPVLGRLLRVAPPASSGSRSPARSPCPAARTPRRPPTPAPEPARPRAAPARAPARARAQPPPRPRRTSRCRDGVELTAQGSELDGRRHGHGGLRAAPGRGRRARHHGDPAREDVVRGVVRRLAAGRGDEEGQPLLRARDGQERRRHRPRRAPRAALHRRRPQHPDRGDGLRQHVQAVPEQAAPEEVRDRRPHDGLPGLPRRRARAT